jgi:hypothetical protein
VGGMRKRASTCSGNGELGSRLHELWILSLFYHHWPYPLRFGGALAVALESEQNCELSITQQRDIPLTDTRSIKGASRTSADVG